jgi:hypothetical protein
MAAFVSYYVYKTFGWEWIDLDDDKNKPSEKTLQARKELLNQLRKSKLKLKQCQPSYQPEQTQPAKYKKKKKNLKESQV